MKKLAILSMLMIVCATPAFAQLSDMSRRTAKWDFSVQTRYTAAKDFSGAYGSRLSMDDDLGWGFGFDYHLNERLDLGFLMSWRSIPYNATAVDATDASNTVNYSNWLDTGTFAADATWNILPRRVTPYLTGSLGWTLINTNISAGISSGCWWDPWWGYVCSSYVSTYGADAFTYSAGVGVRLEVTQAVFFKVGYDWAGVDIDSADSFNIFRVDAGIMIR